MLDLVFHGSFYGGHFAVTLDDIHVGHVCRTSPRRGCWIARGIAEGGLVELGCHRSRLLAGQAIDDYLSELTC